MVFCIMLASPNASSALSYYNG